MSEATARANLASENIGITNYFLGPTYFDLQIKNQNDFPISISQIFVNSIWCYLENSPIRFKIGETKTVTCFGVYTKTIGRDYEYSLFIQYTDTRTSAVYNKSYTTNLVGKSVSSAPVKTVTLLPDNVGFMHNIGNYTPLTFGLNSSVGWQDNTLGNEDTIRFYLSPNASTYQGSLYYNTLTPPFPPLTVGWKLSPLGSDASNYEFDEYLYLVKDVTSNSTVFEIPSDIVFFGQCPSGNCPSAIGTPWYNY